MNVPSHPVLSCAEAKAWESQLLRDEAAEWAAMQHAGAAIADEIVQDYREMGGFPGNARILVLVGKGHNGGDALLAAGELLRKYPGASAEVVFAFDQDSLRPLAARAWQPHRESNRVRVSPGLADPAAQAATYDLCLDGVFGMQFRRPLDEKVAELLARANTHPRIRFRAAIDLPSGLGEQNADTVFRADFTYATGVVKEPVLRPENGPFVGRVRYLDLGFFPVERATPGTPGRILLADVLSPLAALRRAQTDKRTYGHLFVVGGSLSYPGAVVLAVRAALRSGVGLVTAFVPESLVADYSARHPEAMWVGCPVNAAGAMTPAGFSRVGERISRATALAVGPGLTADPGALSFAARLAAEASVPLLLDADALRPEVVEKAAGRPFIVTPHAGELSRIAPLLIDGNRVKTPFGVVVAKGPITRVLCRGDTYHSLFGGPVLARGGSGDLLAGLTAGLLAQNPADPLLAACRGVVWHGRSADLLARARGQVAVEISEILEHLGRALVPTPCPTSPS
ncbi:MAG TPA: NAD(P)H-hydrate dehydratase [Opitutaceae bacterium]|nr:NAD(P)H-hydrate dehydratase [Opitutaceae bacterium]